MRLTTVINLLFTTANKEMCSRGLLAFLFKMSIPTGGLAGSSETMRSK